ncbi:glycoside-pentoside-hexuronide (GPH):cation symporter [Virgibacillus halophilus]|uniref:Glycoside-pentoside-hexuronide (GPH):cation symporter n=1 Tax=Tigheibacillus halophilus TaxID=361280 RepID=A0ABU5C467_9BACI|nr:glycoside-pentoside-hexuronide (GPH):cation symporter [Virgibacillus halophilus]
MEAFAREKTKLGRERHKLSLKEKISYGYGEMASAFVWGMVTSYLLYFYTDVYGISASAAGTLFLITRLWDAANDPIMGVIVDRTKTKHGKARPYLLYLAIPLGIISVLTFITPDFSDTGRLMYAYVTYLLLGMIYTAINLPYGALAPTMTRDSKEKVDLGSYRAMGLAVGTVIVSAATLPLVNFLGKGNEQVGFPLTITLYSVIAGILFFLTFKNCKERYSEYIEAKDRKKLSESLKEMFKNRPWVLVAITSFLKFLRLGALNAVLIYYVTYVLGKPGMVPVFLTLLNGATFAGGALAMPLLKKVGNKLGTQVAIAIGSVFFILLFFIQGGFSYTIRYNFLFSKYVCWGG